MTSTPNRQRKPSCNLRSAVKPEASENSPRQPRTISKMILISIVLGGVAITAIIRGFDGLIEIKLGIEGGQVLIDGRKPPLSSPITDNSSNKN